MVRRLSPWSRTQHADRWWKKGQSLICRQLYIHPRTPSSEALLFFCKWLLLTVPRSFEKLLTSSNMKTLKQFIRQNNQTLEYTKVKCLEDKTNLSGLLLCETFGCLHDFSLMKSFCLFLILFPCVLVSLCN